MPAANASRRITAAILLGLAVGLRTFSAPAALALGKRPLSGPRRAVLLAAAGEMIADKLPAMPSRLERRGLTGRLLSGAIAGGQVAGSPGAAGGASAALASAFVGHRARAALSNPLAAVAEDCVAVSLAALGASRAAR